MNKNIKIFINYFFGPLLFIWLSYSIYRQILCQPQLSTSWQYIKESFQSLRLLHLLSVVALMLVNWGLEARKWQLSVQPIYPVSFLQSFKAILSGVSFSVTTPNRVGEYLGRMMYMPEGSRLKSISVTLVGSMSQLLITLLCGTLGLIQLGNRLIEGGVINHWMYRLSIAALVVIILLSGVIYFRMAVIEKLMERWMKKSYVYLIESLRRFNVQLLSRLLLLSFLRYLVFIAQYYLVFLFFGIDLGIGTVWSVVSVLFLAMAVIPTIALIEVGVRGEISLRLLSLFTTNSLGVGLTSVTIWLINLILPAVVGSLLILSIKVFKRKDETD